MNKCPQLIWLFIPLAVLQLNCTQNGNSAEPLATDTIIGEVMVKQIAIEGSTYNTNYRARPHERYGRVPLVAMEGNAGNLLDVAYLDKETRHIRIVRINEANRKVQEIKVSAAGETDRLLGISRIPGDNSIVLGYSKDNNHGNSGFEYWITRLSEQGHTIFNTRIFGSQPAGETWAKGEPGEAASGRIAYNPATNRIGFYTGHTMKWDDGIRHQGGYIGFLNAKGQQLTRTNSNSVLGDTWFFSHNFNQRMIVADGKYITLAHGDAYPRALGFNVWNDDTTTTSNELQTNYFDIPGAQGDNTTHTETGGIVELNDGNFGVIFASSVNREKRDVCFKKISPEGQVLLTKWLTSNTGTDAYLPRIARKGPETIFIAWAQYEDYTGITQFLEIDYSGSIVAAQKAMPEIALQPYYDLINLPNGDIVWAVGKEAHKLTVYRIRP